MIEIWFKCGSQVKTHSTREVKTLLAQVRM